MHRLLATLLLLCLPFMPLLPGQVNANEPPGQVLSDAPVSAAPRHVVLIIPDGMTRANEAGLSWYLNGQAGGDFSLSFHSWPLQVPVTTWDLTTYNKYADAAGAPRFSLSSFDPLLGYDHERGGNWPLLHPDARTDAYFLHGQAGRDARGAQPATDSASAATAMACGVKVFGGELAWSSEAEQALIGIGQTLREQRAGRAGHGVVSTVPISHATPAGFSSYSPKRSSYHEIAHRQLLNLPDVLAGGGHPLFDKDYLDGKAPKYLRLEQLDWLREHPALAFSERREGQDAATALQYASAQARAGQWPLYGLFGGSSGMLNRIRADSTQPDGFDHGSSDQPNCWDLTRTALEVLSDSERFPDGFFLMVEQGDLDWANHDGNWAWGLGATWDAHNCAAQLIRWIESGQGHGMSLDNTLVLLLSDHGHYHRVAADWRPAAGQLPRGADSRADPAITDEYRRRYSPDGEVIYSRALHHSNELVMLYAWGAGGADGLAALLEPYLGRSYRGTEGTPGTIDNTAIYHIMAKWLGLDPPSQPGMPGRS